jgi:N-acyl homoserine lactone hydrolase
VVILSAPGHTPGHQVLFIDLEEYGPVVLSGDLYPTKENREKRLVPSFNFDRDSTLASMERIEAFIEERGARMIVQHSVEDYEALPHSPEVLR